MRKIFYSLVLAAPVCMAAPSADLAPVQSVAFKQEAVPFTQGTDGTRVAMAPSRSLASEVGVIEEAPAGKHEIFTRSGEGWWIELINAERITFDYHGGEMVFEDDGTVYLFNPSANFVSNSYLVGYVEGNKMTFELPQPIFAGHSDWNDSDYVYYACMLDYIPSSATTGTYKQSAEQILTFSKQSDGSWKMDGPSDGGKLFGMVDHDGDWFGYGDWDVLYQPFNTPVETPPANLQTETWVMKYSGTGHRVQVGIDGEDMWVKGMATELPDSWVKGVISGKYVSFQGGQYMGMDAAEYFHNYFYGATVGIGTNPVTGKDEWQYKLADRVRFEYNAAAKNMFTDVYVDLNANPSVEVEASHYIYKEPDLQRQSDVISLTPCKIDVMNYSTWIKDFECGGIDFDFLQYNIDGDLLDTAHLYYAVIVDEDYLEIDPAEYTMVPEAMTFIPYYYVDYDMIFGRKVAHEFYFYIQGFDYMGIRAIYIEDNGTKHFGPITNCYGVCPEIWDTKDQPDPEVGVDEVYVSEEIGEYFTDLSGVRVNNPEKGLYIRTVKYADGSVKSFKVVK